MRQSLLSHWWHPAGNCNQTHLGQKLRWPLDWRSRTKKDTHRRKGHVYVIQCRRTIFMLVCVRCPPAKIEKLLCKLPQRCSRICQSSRTDSNRSCIWPSQRDTQRNELQRRETTQKTLVGFHSTDWTDEWNLKKVSNKDNKPSADDAISSAANISSCTTWSSTTEKETENTRSVHNVNVLLSVNKLWIYWSYNWQQLTLVVLLQLLRCSFNSSNWEENKRSTC